MKSLTEHLWLEVPSRRGFVNITATVEELVRKSGVQEGLCLVNAMHITKYVAHYATAIRYMRMASEACVVALSRNGAIKSSFSSDEARFRRFGNLSIDALATNSPGILSASSLAVGEIREQGHNASTWFTCNGAMKVWENCVNLGEGYFPIADFGGIGGQ